MRSWEQKGKNITNAIAPDACIGAHLHAHIHALVDTFIQPVIETQTSERTHEIVLFVSPKMTSSLKKKRESIQRSKGN